MYKIFCRRNGLKWTQNGLGKYEMHFGVTDNATRWKCVRQRFIKTVAKTHILTLNRINNHWCVHIFTFQRYYRKNYFTKECLHTTILVRRDKMTRKCGRNAPSKTKVWKCLRKPELKWFSIMHSYTIGTSPDMLVTLIKPDIRKLMNK